MDKRFYWHTYDNVTDLEVYDEGTPIMEMPQNTILLGSEFKLTFGDNTCGIAVKDMTPVDKIMLREEAATHGKKIYFQCDYADYLWREMLQGKYY